MTITQTVLQLTAHPLLLRLAMVAAAITFFIALNALAKGVSESHWLFGDRTAHEALRAEERQVVAVAYFW